MWVLTISIEVEFAKSGHDFGLAESTDTLPRMNSKYTAIPIVRATIKAKATKNPIWALVTLKRIS
jgi:hypothetical protein